MSGNTITDLRTEPFDTMRAPTRSKDPMDIERARAVSDIAQTIINSAKVEVDHLRITGGKGSGFIPEAKPLANPDEPEDTKVIEKRPGVTITQHRLRG